MKEAESSQMDKWTVYKHTTPNNKVYIGITHQKPEDRWGCGHGYKTNTHFYKAILKYGWKNIAHEILAEGLTQAQAEELERTLIFQCKSYDKQYGYNKALGGHALSEESRRKIGETRKARGITSWTLGKHLSAETRAKISAGNKGKTFRMSDEAKQRISEAKRGPLNPNYGKRPSDESIRLRVEKVQRPVIQICECTETIYKSIKEASEVTGVAACNISRVCNGQRKAAGGYRWKYA